MTSRVIIIGCVALWCFSEVSAQETDLYELTTTLSLEDIPVRVPPSQFKFNKDRTPSAVTKRIIGGDEATAHEYPYQAALYVYVYITLYFCGGTLITPEWVLTAAHCIQDSTSTLVVLGAHDLNVAETSRVVYNSTTFIIHENWDSATIQYDIALIRLPENVTLSSYINTVPIAYGSDQYSGVMSRCLGWGRTILGSLSNVLRYVDAEVMTNDACKSYEDYEGYIVDHHLCTSGEGIVGSCNGDSGGPLIINGTQVGIVSFGHSDCALGYPSVYTRLTNFYTWVDEQILLYDTTNESESSGSVPKIKPYSIRSIVGIIFSFIIVNYVKISWNKI